MGQEQSAQSRELSPEQLSAELANRFASKCYTPLEIYCFKEVFKTLAEETSGITHWTEDSLCKYLEIPGVLEVGPVLFQMVTFLGAFPFPSQAPCIVTREALLKVVTLMTARYEQVIKTNNDRLKLFYGSLAVMDRRASDILQKRPDPNQEPTSPDPLRGSISQAAGFKIDEPINDDYEESEEDAGLALAFLDSMDATAVIGIGDAPNTLHSIIPTDNFFKLIQLLLLVAPLTPQGSLASYANLIQEDALPELRAAAKSILAAFDVEEMPGVTFKTFRSVVTGSMPHLFQGLNSLFENFLFEKSFDLSKRSASSVSPTPTPAPSEAVDALTYLQPDATDLLSALAYRQLSFLLSSSIFGTLHPLYRAATSGFSPTSFSTSVFPWPGATILLLSGTILPDDASGSQERAFYDTLSPPRYPSSKPPGERVVYGAYIPTQWSATHRTPISTKDTLLFQLSPTHDAFRASEVATDYVTFSTAPHGHHPGIGFGVPLGMPSTGQHNPVPLGPVSLFIDASLEYAVFTHTAPSSSLSSTGASGYSARTASSGGTFLPSSSPRRRKQSWQDRIEIEHIEVFGIGGAKEKEKRRRELEFEENEARLRREGKNALGVAGYEADREILKMAGLVGHGEGGGSMG